MTDNHAADATNTCPSESSSDNTPDVAILDPWEKMVSEREERRRKYEDVSSQPDYIKKLKRASASYFDTYEFSDGDLCMWAPHMQASAHLSYHRPAVFIRYFDFSNAQIENASDAAQLWDCILGVLDGDGDLVTFPADSRRLINFDKAGGDGPRAS